MQGVRSNRAEACLLQREQGSSESQAARHQLQQEAWRCCC